MVRDPFTMSVNALLREIGHARWQAAGVTINVLCPFLQLSSGLNLSACTCWGGIHPHSLRHTPRARQNGRSDHILKYRLQQVAAMGITSRLRGSSPGR